MSAGTTASPTRRGRGLALAVGAGLLAAAGGAAAWYFGRTPAPTPPAVSTEGVDPAVAAAIDRARQEVLARPRNAAAWGELGQALRAYGWKPEAVRCFAEAERLDPQDARWPYLTGVMNLLTADDPVPPLRRAVARGHPEPAYRDAARLRLAEALLDARALDEAEELFREALDPNSPQGVRAAYGLGVVAAARGDVKAAAARFGPIAADPHVRKKVAAQMARLARRAGDEAAAARHERDAARPPEDQPWPDPFVSEYRRGEGRKARTDRADSLAARGRVNEAIQAYRELAGEFPDGQSYLTLGTVLVRAGRYAEAAPALRESLRFAPDQPQALTFLAVARFREAESQADRALARELLLEAVEHATRAGELKPDAALAHLTRGQALARLGQPAAADALRRAIAASPELAEAHLSLGEVLAGAGRADEAVRELRLAEQLADPGDDRAKQALARVQAAGSNKRT
jgi:tetratricopeptide (TPR) repeat protein